MSTKLRLSAEAASALRDASTRTARSQQDLLREAVDRFLGLGAGDQDSARAVATGLVRAPTEFLDVEASVRLQRGQTTMQLLDRDER
jgi:hypothetical protein